MKNILLKLGLVSSISVPTIAMNIAPVSEDTNTLKKVATNRNFSLSSTYQIPDNIIVNPRIKNAYDMLVENATNSLKYLIQKNSENGTINEDDYTDFVMKKTSPTADSIIEFKYIGSYSNISLDSSHAISMNDTIKLVIHNTNPVASDGYDKTKFGDLNTNDVVTVDVFVQNNKISTSFFYKEIQKNKLKMIAMLSKAYYYFTVHSQDWYYEYGKDKLADFLSLFLTYDTIHALGKSTIAASNVLTFSEIIDMIEEFSKLQLITHSGQNPNGFYSHAYFFKDKVDSKYLNAGNTKTDLDSSQLSSLNDIFENFGISAPRPGWLYGKTGLEQNEKNVTYVLFIEDSSNSMIGFKYLNDEKKMIQNLNSEATIV